MTFNAQYADIYDALYREKDYPRESAFVLDCMRAVGLPEGARILDIGCGTGRHAVLLAQQGLSVCGMDASSAMLSLAEKRRFELAPALQNRLSFFEGDARDFSRGSEFDGAVSLFHVMSYMANEGDIGSALRMARRHLRKGAPFLFDFWYGPAVEAAPPEHRERDIDKDGHRIKRITTPSWDRKRHVIDIKFQVQDEDSASGETRHGTETHCMRYFFGDEIGQELSQCGFAMVEIGEWLTRKPPTADSFGVYALARAV